MLSHVWASPASQNWPVCRHSLGFPHWWMSCLSTENNRKHVSDLWTFTPSQATLQGSVTFEQQRHEWDVRRTEFGHCQSVGPVVTWGILNGGTTAHYYLHFQEFNEMYINRSSQCNSPSASHRHSKSFWSCWGFAAADKTKQAVIASVNDK